MSEPTIGFIFLLFRFFLSSLFDSLTTILSPSTSFHSLFYCFYLIFCLLFFDSFSFSLSPLFIPCLSNLPFILQHCVGRSVNRLVTNDFQPRSQITTRNKSSISCAYTHTRIRGMCLRVKEGVLSYNLMFC
jgi:hypothetical protein